MQLAYSQTMAVAFAGMVADNGDKNVLSRVNTVDPAVYGTAQTLGTDPDRDVEEPDSSADVTASIQGVVLSSQSIEQPLGGSATPRYPVGSDVPLLTKGRVWVTAEEAVTPASAVFIRFAAGAGGTQLGAFRASADTASAVAAPTSWKYRTSAGAGELVVLEINAP